MLPPPPLDPSAVDACSRYGQPLRWP